MKPWYENPAIIKNKSFSLISVWRYGRERIAIFNAFFKLEYLAFSISAFSTKVKTLKLAL